MKIPLLFATTNANKVREIEEMLPPFLSLTTLKDLGIVEDLSETGKNLKENAIQKAMFTNLLTGKDCFAEDTGLEITALGGAPGIHSARYAGPERNTEANIKLVLEQLENMEDRSASFRTFIALQFMGQMHLFEGSVSGSITFSTKGTGGFGYDPIFVPDGGLHTWGESPELKKVLSHRKLAFLAMSNYLLSINQ